MLSTSSATNTEMIEKYKNYIAVDVAYVYVERVLDIAKQINRSGQVQPAAADAKEALGKLTAQLTDISTRLHNKRVEETSAIMKAAELERQLQFQHQAMIAGIPAQAFTSMQVFN
jgi:ABC-type Fe3+-hydroxamate transport system substrate-binding protein